MQRLLCSIVALLIFSCSGLAQQNVVYLKNGSVIKANIMKLIPGDKVELQTSDGSIFVFPMDEVQEILIDTERRPAPSVNPPKEQPNRLQKEIELSEFGFKRRGYINITEIGGRFSVDNQLLRGFEFRDATISGFHIATINGYQFNEHFTLGLGIGFRTYNADYSDLPVFLDFRYSILKKKVTPVVYASGGYTYPLDGGIGSLDIEGGFGLKNYFTENIAFHLLAGTSVQYYDFDVPRTYIAFVGVKAGVSF